MKTKAHGGRREGAGRKPGSNRFGEPTERVRVPRSALPAVTEMLDELVATRGVKKGELALLRPREERTPLARPLFSSLVAAGFPSPADDYIEGRLDLNEHFVTHPSATFYVRVSGESMTGAGIFPGDILIVDRSLEAKHGSIVIAVVDNELTVKRLHRWGGKIELRPENKAYPVIPIDGEMELVIWGVVSGVVRKLS